MSNYIDAEGYFDKVGLQEIGTSSPQVVNGAVAEALWILQADQKQADLLHFGPSFSCIGGGQDRQFGAAASSKSGVIGFLAPAFCDRVSFGMYARGSGTLTLNSNYTLTMDNGVGAYGWVWGSLTENLVGVTPSAIGSPEYKKIDYAKGAGLDVISLVIRYGLSSEKLS